MPNTTHASVASRLTNEEIEHLAQAAEQEIQFWEAADAAAAVLRDYVRLRNNCKKAIATACELRTYITDPYHFKDGEECFDEIHRLLAEAEKGETK